MIHQTTTLAGTNESQDREAKIIDFGRSLQRRRSPFGLQVFRADNDVVSAVADIPTPSIPTDIPQDARWFIELLTGDADTPVNWRAFIDDDNDPRKKMTKAVRPSGPLLTYSQRSKSGSVTGAGFISSLTKVATRTKISPVSVHCSSIRMTDPSRTSGTLNRPSSSSATQRNGMRIGPLMVCRPMSSGPHRSA